MWKCGPCSLKSKRALPFFSRRIGLDDSGHAVPILGGGRLTGRAGKYSVGIVNIQTRQDEALNQAATNFSVLRVRRDILRRSNIGALFVNRSAYGSKLRGNQAYGIDGVFSFFQNLNINTYFAGTQTPELSGDDRSYRGQLEYNADRYGLVLEQMLVGKNFNPETGYVRRKDIRRTVAEGRFSPRPQSSTWCASTSTRSASTASPACRTTCSRHRFWKGRSSSTSRAATGLA